MANTTRMMMSFILMDIDHLLNREYQNEHSQPGTSINKQTILNRSERAVAWLPTPTLELCVTSKDEDYSYVFKQVNFGKLIHYRLFPMIDRVESLVGNRCRKLRKEKIENAQASRWAVRQRLTLHFSQLQAVVQLKY
jgi:hypothetical protein